MLRRLQSKLSTTTSAVLELETKFNSTSRPPVPRRPPCVTEHSFTTLLSELGLEIFKYVKYLIAYFPVVRELIASETFSIDVIIQPSDRLSLSDADERGYHLLRRYRLFQGYCLSLVRCPQGSLGGIAL